MNNCIKWFVVILVRVSILKLVCGQSTLGTVINNRLVSSADTIYPSYYGYQVDGNVKANNYFSSTTAEMPQVMDTNNIQNVVRIFFF